MIVWGGTDDVGDLEHRRPVRPGDGHVGARRRRAPGVPAGRDEHTAVWTGTEMIVWGGSSGAADLNTGGRYNPVDRHLDGDVDGRGRPAGSPRSHGGVDRDGDDRLGRAGRRRRSNTGGRYDPATDTWTRDVDGRGRPVGARDHTAVWTGRR